METLKKDVSKLVTITDYAKKKSISRQTVYNWIAEKKITVIIIGGISFIEA